MRYGLLWDDGDRFTKDVHVGVELDDEPVAEGVIVVPDCPPETCAPVLDRVHFSGTGVFAGTPDSSDVVRTVDGATLDFDLNSIEGAFDYSIFILHVLPEMKKCEHRTRAVVTKGTAEWTTAATIAGGDGLSEHDGVLITYRSVTHVAAHHTGTIQMQIDLTDAAPGSETWTDFGPLININDFT